MVEHPDDFTTFIVHNSVRSLVIESWDSKTASVVWILLKVNVAKMREALVNRIRRDTFARNVLVRGCETPA